MGKQTKVNVAELDGAALDWAVAQVVGVELNIIDMPSGPYVGIKGRTPDGFPNPYSPSTDWSLGGPLIEQHVYRLQRNPAGVWSATTKYLCYGSTALIAAMRAIVAAELGDVVAVPAELLTQKSADD